MPNDGTVLGNVSGGGGVLQRKTFKYLFLHFFFPLSSFLSISPYLSPYVSSSLSSSPSPLLFLTLSSSLSFSLSCGFCLDRVLAGLKNDFR